MAFIDKLDAAREASTAEEDRSAFRHGAQIANEAILRAVLLVALDAFSDPDTRKRAAAQIRDVVEKTVALRLKAAQVPNGVEAESARAIIASVFDDLLAADAPETSG